MTKDYLYAFQTWRYDEPCMSSKFDRLKACSKSLTENLCVLYERESISLIMPLISVLLLGIARGYWVSVFKELK